jgi:hypothetical protein
MVDYKDFIFLQVDFKISQITPTPPPHKTLLGTIMGVFVN